jgi:capsular polysaccharide biosynthesis protein
VTLDDPPTMRATAAGRVEGRGCYIGHIYNHFGHFLTEGLSSLWAGNDFEYYAAHPFIFGGMMPSYSRTVLKSLGFDPGKILVIREPLVFADITVPERTWYANKAAVSAFRGTVDRIATPYQTARGSLRIYLSRSKVELRAVPNEGAIEEAFSKRGFLVIHPERLGIESQLSLYGQAGIIAGFGGSALHNLLLCPRGTRTIVLGDERARSAPIQNQRICASLRDGQTTMIPYRSHPDGFDLPYLESELNEALEAARA